MILSDPILFAISLIITGSILFLLIYFVITLSDLECDYLNEQQCCARLNQWVLPKMVAHLFTVFILLLHGHWLLSLVNIPMGLWILYEYFTVPPGNLGVYEPTEIYNRRQLKTHMRDCMIHLGHYLLFFFAYLYCMMVSLLASDPWNPNNDEEILT